MCTECRDVDVASALSYASPDSETFRNGLADEAETPKIQRATNRKMTVTTIYMYKSLLC